MTWSTSAQRLPMSRASTPGRVPNQSATDRVAKRIFDVAVSSAGLVLSSPVLVAIAAVIRASSPGPILFRAPRVGRDGRVYTMHKFRTMTHSDVRTGARITGPADKRVFPAGEFLRHMKLDELPQLWDVLRGEMSIVGPRPEDPEIVDRYYDAAMRETLLVRPGLTSPGSLFGSTHPELLLGGEDTEKAYAELMLPTKLALERVYVARQSFWYDTKIVARTVGVVIRLAAGRDSFPTPPEMKDARRLLAGSSA